jgi:hypothetical protein
VVDVLVKMTGDRSGDGTGVTTVEEDGTCNKREGTVEGKDGDDVGIGSDTIAVGFSEVTRTRER